MGKVSWFLGSKYEWGISQMAGSPTVSITQTSKIEELIDCHGMSKCNPVSSPYRSGYSIDRIPSGTIPLEEKHSLIKKYQSIISSLLWVQ
jgi:hypothetical protein